MSWDRILGHDANREKFIATVNRGRLAHAYLFVGPQGVGKKLFALEIAKALLCEAPPAPVTACDRCPSCLLVKSVTHPDLVICSKPEEKSELSVDTIREFCANWGLKPSRGTRKIAILEDADDFNEESANAMLKTLEEPPPGSLLILLATSLETQLATIRSRCQQIHFSSLTNSTIQTILKQNGIDDPARCQQLAKLAQGSAALAIQLADEAVGQFRTELFQTLAVRITSSAPLLDLCVKFVESVGKDAPKQRGRAIIVVRLLAELLIQALHHSVGMSTTSESSACEHLSKTIGTERLIELLDRLLESQQYFDRYITSTLVIERIVDLVGRLLI